MIEFTDNGEGIHSDKIEQIFDPFFTTKQNGTGLGMSISYGIIQNHGGDIEIESSAKEVNPADHGTVVRIWLPVM